MVDETKRRRRGPEPLDAAVKREHCVSVRLNLDELERLDAQRAPVNMQRGEYLRAAALHRLPPTIPSVNRDAWVELSRLSSNVNQLARAVNEGRADLPNVDLAELYRAVADLRLSLIAVGDADESED